MKSHIDSISGFGGYATVNGWAVWPDKLTSSVTMALQIDTNSWVAMTANAVNPEGDAAVPGAGNNHGFTLSPTLAQGNHQICVWADQSVGPAVNIGCQTVTVTAPTA